jgi:hypothetical protein
MQQQIRQLMASSSVTAKKTWTGQAEQQDSTRQQTSSKDESAKVWVFAAWWLLFLTVPLATSTLLVAVARTQRV